MFVIEISYSQKFFSTNLEAKTITKGSYWLVHLIIIGLFFIQSHPIHANSKEKTILLGEIHRGDETHLKYLNSEERQMIDALKSLAFGNQVQLIYKNQGDYFATNDCSLKVYIWKGTRWEVYAGKEVSGANCSSNLFFIKNEVYAFSGMGYWQGQTDLFHFTKSGEVKFVKTNNQPEDFFGTLNFSTENGFFSFFGNRLNRRKGVKDFLWKGYFLDYSDWTWKEVGFDLNSNFESALGAKSFGESMIVNASFETSDYSFIEVTNTVNDKVALFIVDKRSLTTYIKPLVNHQFQGFVKWMHQDKNHLRFFIFYKSTESEFQLDDLVKSAIPVGRVVFKENSFWSSLRVEQIILFSLISSALIVLGLYLSKSKPRIPNQEKEKQSTDLEESQRSILQKIIPHLGRVITQEAMDEILGIQDLKNQDIRKTNRSRAIKSINEAMQSKLGETLITRVRDKEDKRVIHYQIASFSSGKQPNERRKNPASV